MKELNYPSPKFCETKKNRNDNYSHKVPEFEVSEILLLKKIKIFNYMKDAGSEGEVTTDRNLS